MFHYVIDQLQKLSSYSKQINQLLETTPCLLSKIGQSDTSVASRAYRADDPSRLVADIAQPARSMAALPPDIAGPPFLSDPRLILAPDFKPLGLGMCLRDFG